MFEHSRQRPIHGGAGAPVLSSDQPAWLRRPILGRHADRDLPTHLDRELKGMGAVLHDVRLPRMTRTLDHLVVAPSGVWLIDTVRVTGRLTRRDAGTRQEPDPRLMIDGIDRTQLVNDLGILRQAHHAVTALQLGVNVQTVTCLIDASWPLSARPFQVHNHWVTWPRALTDKIKSSGLVAIRTAHDIGQAIAERQVVDAPVVPVDIDVNVHAHEVPAAS